MGGGDMAVSSNDVVEEVTLNIHCSSGLKFAVQVKLNSTVEYFKSILAQRCEIPTQQQRLIFKGRILKDDQTLGSYGLAADHIVHLVRGFATATPADGAASTHAGVRSTDSNPTMDTGTNEGARLGGSGFEPSLFPGLGLNGLGSGSGLFGAALPEMEQMQRQLTQNPNLIRDILNMPFVQNLMNNPETIHNLIRNNPQMREIMDRNPELAHVLNDPDTLRQTMEAARNPEIMREMMRNTNRAMSNIESSPGGFNMLRRMYENVQEPLLNATTMNNGTRSDLGNNPFTTLSGARGGGLGRGNSTNSSTAPAPNANPLPNPWASAGTGGTQTNSSAQSNPVGDVRPASPGDLGGPGFPELERVMGSMPDLTSVNQLMQNPVVSQMMRNLSSSPQFMNQILGLSPQLRNMFDSNPWLRDLMQNPGFIRQLTSPEAMQQLLNFSQAQSSQLGRQTSREQGQNAGETAGTADNLGLNMLMKMFGGLGSGGGLTTNRPRAVPEELYATQLSQLQEMGFFDTQENIEALFATGGNVHAAVERLLGNSGA